MVDSQIDNGTTTLWIINILNNIIIYIKQNNIYDIFIINIKQ